MTVLTACPFLIKKCAKMSVFYVKTVTICWRLDAKPPVADEYLRFFNKKKRLFFALLIKNIPLFIAKTPSTCNRNFDLGYLVNPSGLFYDDKYSLAMTSNNN